LQLSFAGGNTTAYKSSLSKPDRLIAPLLSSLPEYAEKMSGKNRIELRVALGDSVRVSVGVADCEAHVKLPAAEPAWTLLQIKQNLRDSAGEADGEVEVMPSTGCTVAELKAMLQTDHKVPWAVASSKCLNEMS
jgi:hypothetical protein